MAAENARCGLSMCSKCTVKACSNLSYALLGLPARSSKCASSSSPRTPTRGPGPAAAASDATVGEAVGAGQNSALAPNSEHCGIHGCDIGRSGGS